MKKTRFSEEQIAFALRLGEATVCRLMIGARRHSTGRPVAALRPGRR